MKRRNSRCLRLGLAPVLATTIVVAAAAAPADWPQWRGPNRDAVSTERGLLPEWPPSGPKLLWKATGLGTGFSSIAIAGGRIYTMGGQGDEESIVALDLATRNPLWTAPVGKLFKESRGDGPRCTPTVDDGMVYALGAQGDLVCVAAATGKEVWRKDLKKDFGGRMMSGWGYSESPLIDGNKLICTPGGNGAALVALDKKTGALVWKAAVPVFGTHGKDGAGYASCVVAEVGGIRQYVALLGRGLVGVAAADGRFLWGYDRMANGTANCSTPIVRGDYVFASTAYGAGSALVRLVPAAGGIKAEEVWFLDAKTLQNHHGGMVLLGDYLYGGHGQNAGQPVCVEFKTGRVAWRAEKTPGGGSASVVAADGKVYFRYEKGDMVLIDAAPAGYQTRGQFRVASVTGPGWAHPVIYGGCLYLRDNDTLLCYDVKGK